MDFKFTFIKYSSQGSLTVSFYRTVDKLFFTESHRLLSTASANDPLSYILVALIFRPNKNSCIRGNLTLPKFTGET